MCRKFAVAAAAMYQHSVPRKKNIWCVLDYHSMFLSLKRENIRVRGFHLVSLSKMIKKAMKQRKLSLIVYMRDVDHMTSMNRWYFRWSFYFFLFFQGHSGWQYAMLPDETSVHPGESIIYPPWNLTWRHPNRKGSNRLPTINIQGRIVSVRECKWGF